ncbi:hypothetical protein [Roseateles oligotrophus]|uniref:Uncharacterized protein n=1 Tax=Roseateles oligotrophus TaxID=1769250 RepID=A0ABT2YCC1_9BURK|nr:hypothetical protein [Roseateles oligotrophus]MCV2367685.1 hypothetical protein [Roseateles oligotrophus]
MVGSGKWDTESVKWAEAQGKLPGNRRLFASPCGVSVLVHGLGIEATLLLMHHNHLHDAVAYTLVNEDLAKADPRCLADFFTHYGLMNQLAGLLQDAPEACAYVLQHFDFEKVSLICFGGVDRPRLYNDMAKAIAIARSCLAARAARLALDNCSGEAD